MTETDKTSPVETFVHGLCYARFVVMIRTLLLLQYCYAVSRFYFRKGNMYQNISKGSIVI